MSPAELILAPAPVLGRALSLRAETLTHCILVVPIESLQASLCCDHPSAALCQQVVSESNGNCAFLHLHFLSCKKTDTRVSVVLAVQEFWLELGLGQSSSVQLSPQSPRAAQPFSAAPCFWRHCLCSQPTIPLGAPETSSSLAYFCIDSFQIWNSVFRMNVGFPGSFPSCLCVFPAAGAVLSPCPERGSGSVLAGCGCSAPFQV